MKVRQNLYIERSLRDALDALVAREGGNKSRFVNAALEDLLAKRGTKAVDDLFKLRLDRISREITSCRSELGILLEAFALFVRYQLMVTAPIPESDEATLSIGSERFERFISQLGRQLASGRRSLSDGMTWLDADTER